jgi:DNA-binding NarL/FixJ family response regulator
MSPAPDPRQPLISDDEMSALMARPAYIKSSEYPIDIMFADPHPVVIDGLTQNFNCHPDFRVQKCVQDGASAWRELLKFAPDILVMELTLCGKDSLSLIRDLRREQIKTLPVVFTYASRISVQEAIDEGVQGLVFKSKPKEVLMECVRVVHHGKTWFDEGCVVSKEMEDEMPLTRSSILKLLTLRELSVTQMLVRGRSNKEIANTFAIAEGTVKVHLKHIYQKLQCESRVGLLSRIRRDIF